MASKLNLNIDEATTWEVEIEFWENTDKTIPMDISDQTFTGAMQLGESYLPMTMVVTENVVTASLTAVDLTDLESHIGKYDMLMTDNTTTVVQRFLEGTVRASKGVTQ